MSRVNKDGLDKLIEFMVESKGISKEEALEKVLSFGPKTLSMRGLLIGSGWRAGYTKQTLEKRTSERRRKEKNRRRTNARKRNK